jgi:hypothetical protein
MSTDMDTCFDCWHKMTTQCENMPYLGLPGVTLLSVNVSRCPNCSEYEVEIPMLDDLNRRLVLAVMNKPGHLDDAEIRFLRAVLGSD